MGIVDHHHQSNGPTVGLSWKPARMADYLHSGWLCTYGAQDVGPDDWEISISHWRCQNVHFAIPEKLRELLADMLNGSRIRYATILYDTAGEAGDCCNVETRIRWHLVISPSRQALYACNRYKLGGLSELMKEEKLKTHDVRRRWDEYRRDRAGGSEGKGPPWTACLFLGFIIFLFSLLVPHSYLLPRQLG